MTDAETRVARAFEYVRPPVRDFDDSFPELADESAVVVEGSVEGEKPGFSFDEYQRASMQTAVYPGQGTIVGAMYAALGLNGEAGEVAEHAKKAWRDELGADEFLKVDRRLLMDVLDYHNTDYSSLKTFHEAIDLYEKRRLEDLRDAAFSEERREKVRKEIGDVLWYAAAEAEEWGLSLADCAEGNVAKLQDRKARGKLGGSGDDR